MEDRVTLERRQNVALITINRPETLNALDMDTLAALDRAVGAAEADAEVRVLVLTGAGNRAFVAGGDIADLNARQGLAHYLELGERLHTVFRRIETLDKPTISAVNGWALGGGTELLLCTDIRIAADSARFGLPEVNLGLFPGAGGSQRLLRQVAPCKARELMFLGDRITAQDAERIGLINKVVPVAELMAEAFAMADAIAGKSPLVLKLLKRALVDGDEMPLRSALRHEQAMIGLVLDTADAHEGCSAFLDKRPAAFRGV
ncbi:enoyl-CoA hydratase/isomerase family protein [Xanthobacter dioxanivorans]|uniref:Enoyl-CoA hydratase/isomerase family protein n=1 Tax=Xanthobacter dioxanivorans TaxID=2528964 RepID=A0A974PT72_9HYPH|nr:enoyl-CoA hydratase-related protein [Xanthobacter dioxanivorans]QRG09302.1 enoyl-CoA hydratase/isomerase family protein [Xanthobacter dioxanivorans]